MTFFADDYDAGLNLMEKRLRVNQQEVKFNLWDNGGAQEFVSLLPALAEDCTAVLFMFDLTKMSTLVGVKEWFRRVKEINSNMIPFLIGTKFDLFAKLPADQQSTTVKKARNYARLMRAPLIFSSSRLSINVKTIFKAVLAVIFDARSSITEIHDPGCPILELAPYTPPDETQESSPLEQPTLLFHAVADCFKYVDTAYQPQGKHSIGIEEQSTTPNHVIIIFNEQTPSSGALVTIDINSETLNPTLQREKFLSIRDDTKTPWSLSFTTAEDAKKILDTITTYRKPLPEHRKSKKSSSRSKSRSVAPAYPVNEDTILIKTLSEGKGKRRLLPGDYLGCTLRICQQDEKSFDVEPGALLKMYEGEDAMYTCTIGDGTSMPCLEYVFLGMRLHEIRQAIIPTRVCLGTTVLAPIRSFISSLQAQREEGNDKEGFVFVEIGLVGIRRAEKWKSLSHEDEDEELTKAKAHSLKQIERLVKKDHSDDRRDTDSHHHTSRSRTHSLHSNTSNPTHNEEELFGDTTSVHTHTTAESQKKQDLVDRMAALQQVDAYQKGNTSTPPSKKTFLDQDEDSESWVTKPAPSTVQHPEMIAELKHHLGIEPDEHPEQSDDDDLFPPKERVEEQPKEEEKEEEKDEEKADEHKQAETESTSPPSTQPVPQTQPTSFSAQPLQPGQTPPYPFIMPFPVPFWPPYGQMGMGEGGMWGMPAKPATEKKKDKKKKKTKTVEKKPKLKKVKKTDTESVQSVKVQARTERDVVDELNRITRKLDEMTGLAPNGEMSSITLMTTLEALVAENERLRRENESEVAENVDLRERWKSALKAGREACERESNAVLNGASQLKRESDEHKRIVDELKAKIQEVQEEIVEANQRIRESTEQRVKAEIDLKEIQVKQAQLESDKVVVDTELEREQQKSSDLVTSLETMREENERLREKISVLEDKMAELSVLKSEEGAVMDEERSDWKGVDEKREADYQLKLKELTDEAERWKVEALKLREDMQELRMKEYTPDIKTEVEKAIQFVEQREAEKVQAERVVWESERERYDAERQKWIVEREQLQKEAERAFERGEIEGKASGRLEGEKEAAKEGKVISDEVLEALREDERERVRREMQSEQEDMSEQLEEMERKTRKQHAEMMKETEKMVKETLMEVFKNVNGQVEQWDDSDVIEKSDVTDAVKSAVRDTTLAFQSRMKGEEKQEKEQPEHEETKEEEAVEEKKDEDEKSVSEEEDEKKEEASLHEDEEEKHDEEENDEEEESAAAEPATKEEDEYEEYEEEKKEDEEEPAAKEEESEFEEEEEEEQAQPEQAPKPVAEEESEYEEEEEEEKEKKETKPAKSALFADDSDSDDDLFALQARLKEQKAKPKPSPSLSPAPSPSQKKKGMQLSVDDMDLFSF
ncbi:putative Septum-promoting GTP-binding protein 1 [Blattamonas nauphoetae]|uniref:Septum-promoting GTP-binding protein 1 n=1 Tax=Blattamonas nauphoetae TaxID=2049346 RepID=A0ABQ9XMS9_9EUKA|nr:putative Septum-promoting GTP-binding protein 1 [Blattamonas nauphoetae]